MDNVWTCDCCGLTYPVDELVKIDDADDFIVCKRCFEGENTIILEEEDAY